MFQVRTKALNFFAVVIPLYRSGILQCPVDRLQEEKCNVLQNFYNVKTPHDPRLEHLVPDFNRKQTKMLMGKRRRSGSEGRLVRPGPSAARPASSQKPAAKTQPGPNLFLQGCLKPEVCRRKITPAGSKPVERNRVVAAAEQARRQRNSNRARSRRRDVLSRPEHAPLAIAQPRAIASERRILFELERKRNERRGR